MRNSLASSIITTTFRCIAAGFAAGMLFNLAFAVVILLLSLVDQPAAAQEWLPPSEQIAIIVGDNPDPVSAGSACRKSSMLRTDAVTGRLHSSSRVQCSSQYPGESD